MTLMKEAAHPCTMQLRQTQMASKYHMDESEELLLSTGCSIVNFFFPSYIFCYWLSFPKPIIWEINRFHNYS